VSAVSDVPDRARPGTLLRKLWSASHRPQTAGSRDLDPGLEPPRAENGEPHSSASPVERLWAVSCPV
jgi:hypothetical protein